MRRHLAAFFIALTVTLSFSSALNAEIIAPDRVFSLPSSNDKLLITPKHTVVTYSPDRFSDGSESFEEGMRSNGWSASSSADQAFYNVRNIISRQNLLSVEQEINSKFYQSHRAKESVGGSA